MARILTLKEKKDFYQGLIDTPELINEMSDYELAETYQYAGSIIESRKKGLFDLLNRSPRIFEIKKAEAEKMGMNESEVWDFMLNDDLSFVQASGVRNQIEKIKYLREKQKIDNKQLEISAINIQSPDDKFSIKKKRGKGSIYRSQSMFYVLLQSELKKSGISLPKKYNGKTGLITFFREAFPTKQHWSANKNYIEYNKLKNWNIFQMENNHPEDFKRANEYLRNWDIRKMKWFS